MTHSTSSPAALWASVRVPATCANLGPGFDAMGLALAMYDDVTVHAVPSGLTVEVVGEGAGSVALDTSHLVVRALHATLGRLGVDKGGLTLQCQNRIPHGRGLGSSAAAICAGVLLGRALVVGARPDDPPRFDDDAVLTLAAEIEGHPDNVAACLRGGVTIAWIDPEPPGSGHGTARACRIDPDPAIRVVVFIPDVESSTERARGLLPAWVPHADAAFNAARSALLVAALTVDPSFLLTATADRLHQPYRAQAMPESAKLVEDLRGREIAAVISGAGPTVLALTVSTDAADEARAMAPTGWRTEAPLVSRVGARVSQGRL